MTVKELGIIKSTSLGYEDHGILTFWLHFDFGGTGQGFGGYILGGEFTDAVIRGILDAAGVDDWSKLVGRELYAVRDKAGFDSKIIGIEAPAYRKTTPFNILEAIENIKETRQ